MSHVARSILAGHPPAGRRVAALPVMAMALMLALPALGEPAALNGMDAVSLRDSGRVVGGRATIVTHWRGAVWHFTNEANRQAFESNPRAYAPALGGFCAVAMAEGRKLKGDPAQFVIVDQRLFLTHDAAARARMRADPQGIVARAIASWKRIGR